MFWQIIGFSAAILTMFSFIPQIIKVIQRKSAKDVSLVTILQLSLGTLLWIAYGAYLRDKIIIAANIVTFTSLMILLFLYFNYGKGKYGKD